MTAITEAEIVSFTHVLMLPLFATDLFATQLREAMADCIGEPLTASMQSRLASVVADECSRFLAENPEVSGYSYNSETGQFNVDVQVTPVWDNIIVTLQV
jgi:hypothetical protein